MTWESHNALCYTDYAFFGARRGNLKLNRPILSSAKKCSPRSLLSDGIRLPVFLGARGLQTIVGLPKMQFLVISGAYVFGTFTTQATINIRRRGVVYSLSNDPKMFDLE